MPRDVIRQHQHRRAAVPDEVARHAVQKIGLHGVEVVQVLLDRVHRHVGPREQGDAGGYAATEISSTSRSMSGYQRLKMAPNSPLSVRPRVCNNKWAPSLDHCICCFLQNRLLTTSLTVDSTKPIAIASPW